MAPTLYVSISAHGFGHMAQTGPVLEAWMQRFPDSRVVVASSAPASALRRHLGLPFQLLPSEGDIGMRMANALDVRVGESHRAYLDYHADWDGRVRTEAGRIAAAAPDLVLSNIGYASLAAATRLGLPAAALCSLNWADIYAAYCAGLPGAAQVLTEIRAAYAGAALFLVPTPGLWPAWLAQSLAIGPIARRGGGLARAELAGRLGLPASTRLVALAAGGVDLRLPVEDWRGFDRVHWLVPDEWRLQGPSISPFAASGAAFRPMLLGCDAALTKPGYGTFVDAACNGLRLLYIDRGDWPEQPVLADWISRHGAARRIDREAAERGGFQAALQALWTDPLPPPPTPDGAGAAVDRLAALLR